MHALAQVAQDVRMKEATIHGLQRELAALQHQLSPAHRVQPASTWQLSPCDTKPSTLLYEYPPP
jgi:hypothetical protein